MDKVVFGLLDASVQADRYPRPVKNLAPGVAQGYWPHMNCKLVRDPSRGMTIKVIDPSDVEFGRLIPEVSKPLAQLMDNLGSSLRTQPRLLMRKKGPRDWPGMQCSEVMRLTINLYGLRKDAEKVGKYLGQHNLWLRQPALPDKGYPLLNPHTDRNEAKMARMSLTGSINATHDSRTQEEAVTAVSKLFDSVANNAKALPMHDPPPELTTQLLDHQRQGLWWLLQREKPRVFDDAEDENNSLWRKECDDRGAVRYREIVAQIVTTEEPPQSCGGLLADVMGLGKTIEILALLAATKAQAEQYGSEKMIRTQQDSNLLRQTKSTLLVSPVSAIKNWEDQIKDHLVPGALSFYVYHGTNRTQNVYELSKYDVVITTYGTLAADFSKGTASVLHRLKWFRVVLDEAHTCRESKSLQAQAVYAVHAARRWALTGTPIQNRLDDLGSITRFLRLFPYDTPQGFVKHIRSPAVAGNDTFLKSLRVFVDSFTLRRLKDRVGLPPRQDLVCKLQFSDSERKLHDFFRQTFDVEMEEIVERDAHRQKQKKPSASSASPSSGYIRALQGILTLRLICAHGKELLSEANRRLLQGRSNSEAIEVEEGSSRSGSPAAQSFTAEKAYDNLAMMASADLDLCRECMKRIGGDSPTDEDEIDPARGYMLSCNDLLCKDCFLRKKAAFDQASDTAKIKCPFCELDISAVYIAITAEGLAASRQATDEGAAALAKASTSTTLEEGRGIAEDDGASHRQTFYTGPHTKTKALLEDLEAMRVESQAYLERAEAPLKCVIFSEFTSHLDLIERALTDRGYSSHGDGTNGTSTSSSSLSSSSSVLSSFVRIDGTMTLAKRRKVLDALSNSNSVTILLASIKAAGQGLNLTAASRAFIMEPMWNPAAEQQAVDRVHRLGQSRPVVIKRYQVEDSIESKIVQIQRKKIQLAEVSMERNHDKLSRKEERVMHMRDLLSMFK